MSSITPAKTKIVCTLGPVSSSVEMLEKLIRAGMNVARVNFSHGTHEGHRDLIKNIRIAEENVGIPVAILGDLQGPKIRTGKLKGDKVTLVDGQKFIITAEDLKLGDENKVGTTFPALIDDAIAQKEMLLDDGYIILHIDEVTNKEIITTVVKGGVLKNNKGIVIPGVKSTAPSLSDKDIEDLKFCLFEGVDAVAMSFVRSERDIVELRTAMKIFGRMLPVVSKIERVEAIENMTQVVKETDIVMVARGDLGLEIPAEEVPMVQKDIIKKCNYYGKPVIVATQMLESMITNPRPTRAEASDVANAVLDSADAVMLSGETSVGSYPIEAVVYMKKIIKTVEDKYCTIDFVHDVPMEVQTDFSDALANASCVLARQTNATAIISITGTGYTAQYISKYRPSIPIIALTDSINTTRRLCFVWGVDPVTVPQIDDRRDIYVHIGEYISNVHYVNRGENVVFVAGLSTNVVLPQNVIKIYTIPKNA
ncbi:pyruvate kinase [Candidatus Kapabacteria bacterium]|nr:pyruvate kinase [Candidatus Kapabacteria bacterium]